MAEEAVDQLLVATIVGFSILIASMLSVELGLSVAIIEIAFGVVAGNAFGVATTPWIDFLASFASIVLTFLAGAEVDPSLLGRKLKESVLIGGLSFLIPLIGAGLFAFFVAGWNLRLGDRRYRALDHIARRHVRGPRRDRPHEHRDREDDHGGDVRDGPRRRRRAVAAVHHPHALPRALHRRLDRSHRRDAAAQAVVLRAVWRPGHRARDQGGIRGIVPPHVDG